MTGLVHPTYYDACSLVVLESLASGTPVITTSANGASMFIESGKNGYVIPAADVKALVNAVNEMISCGMLHVESTSFDDSYTVFEKIEKIIVTKGEAKMKMLALIQGKEIAASRYRILQYLPYLRENGSLIRMLWSFRER